MMWFYFVIFRVTIVMSLKHTMLVFIKHSQVIPIEISGEFVWISIVVSLFRIEHNRSQVTAPLRHLTVIRFHGARSRGPWAGNRQGSFQTFHNLTTNSIALGRLSVIVINWDRYKARALTAINAWKKPSRNFFNKGNSAKLLGMFSRQGCAD